MQYSCMDQYYDSVFGVGHSNSNSNSNSSSSNSSSNSNYGAHIMQGTITPTMAMGLYNSIIQPQNTYNFTIADSQGQGSNSNGIFESMNRATPYTPEEKKERIERYRSKRNLRNFNKKIKYECRKTLADSRPRVRGRFARNIDDSVSRREKPAAAHEPQYWEYSPFLDEEDDQDYSWTWINILDALNKSQISSF